MDPILDDELKRAGRMKQFQQYQENLEMNKTDKKSASEPDGKMQGKKVNKIEAKDSRTENLFNHFTKPNSKD